MGRKVLIGVLAVALIVSVPGCSSWSRGTKGAVIGGLGGAGLGALIGSAAGSWGWGMVIGAGAGALAGYFIADATAPNEPSPTAPAGAVSEAEKQKQEADSYYRRAMSAKTASESEYYLKKSIDLHPTAAAYNNLGLVYLQAGDRPRAEEAWKKAMEIEPGYRPAAENLAKSRAS